MERYLRVNVLGPGPRLMKKIIYRAAVSQMLRNTALGHCYNGARTDSPQQPGETPDKEVENNHIAVYVSGYTEPDPTVWANKIGLFRADSLARHLLQLAHNPRVRAVGKTYLIEVVRDMLPFWDQRDKSTTTQISSQNAGMKYERK